MITRELDCSVYNETIIFCTQCSPAKFLGYLRKEYDIDTSEIGLNRRDKKAEGLFHQDAEYYILWIKSPTDLITMVHELGHLCIQLFETKGIPITVNNDEAFTYYLSHWVGKLLAVLKEENVSI